MTASGIDWATLRRLYESGSPSVAAICAAAGIARTTLYRRAHRENWCRRRRTGGSPDTARRPRGRGAPRRGSGHDRDRSRPLPGEAQPHIDRNGLLRRLYRALERQIDDIEARIGETQRTSPAGERDARALSSLARTFEKLMEIDGANDGSPQSRDMGDINTLRQELAQRIDRLRREGGD